MQMSFTIKSCSFVWSHLWTYTVNRTSRSYSLLEFHLLVFICYDWYSSSTYSQRFLKYLFSNMKYFQMPQLFYQFYRLYHLPIRNNFLIHVRFLIRTLLFCMNHLHFSHYLSFFSGKFLIPFPIRILRCPKVINLRTSLNIFIAWVSVSSAPNFESFLLFKWSALWSISCNFPLFYFTLIMTLSIEFKILNHFYCRIYRYCSIVF